MRLRQLARKLEVNSEKIVKLLSESGYVLENDANGKLTEEHVAIATAHFVTELDDFIEAKEATDSVEVIESIPVEESKKLEEEPILSIPDLEEELDVPLAPPADITSQISPEHVENEKPKFGTPIVHTGRLFKAIEEEEEDPDIELIKAPKIELEGLKVLGKIDLPEPKAKEVQVKEEKPVEERVPRRTGRKQTSRGKSRNGNSRASDDVNAIEKERQRQARIAARRKREAEERKKQKKTERYLKQVKSKPTPRKAKKKKPVAVEVRSEAPVMYQSKVASHQPTKRTKQNPIRRFWGWLNGEYDKF